MAITVAACTSVEEMTAALAPIWHYFGGRPTPEDTERFSHTLEFARMHAVRENGATIGGAGAFTFELTVPGGTVRAAGVTVVGVLPTHRRRGILRAMMREQLDDVRKRGEPVAYLWASEETIYGRFGYGMASLCGDVEIPKPASAFVRPFEPRADIRLIDEKDALEPFRQIYDRVRVENPGMFSRTEDWWKIRRLSDPESRRQGGGVLNRALLALDGKPEAYALYRLNQQFEPGGTAGAVVVLEALGATPEATREIWRFLLDVDWVAKVKASLLPVDHPLFFLLARPRQMKFRAGDALWVRLVDVHAALAARRMNPGEPVVFAVSDPFCPWNEGRYRVGTGAGKTGAGTVERIDAAADLAVDVNALGSVYLGGFTFAQLARAGRIEELRPGALARADALFATDRAPWCPEIF